MKRLSCILLIGILGACSTSIELPETTTTTPSQEPPESNQRDQRSELRPTTPSINVVEPSDFPENDLEAPYPSIADWLLQRQGICSQSRDAIDAQLQRHRQSFSADVSQDEHILIHSQLQALMLASCEPAQTPGLFTEFIRHMARSPRWPEEYQALFALMSTQLQSYTSLEHRFHELEAQHQKTIEGIGNIERFLESQVEPEP